MGLTNSYLRLIENSNVKILESKIMSFRTRKPKSPMVPYERD